LTNNQSNTTSLFLLTIIKLRPLKPALINIYPVNLSILFPIINY